MITKINTDLEYAFYRYKGMDIFINNTSYICRSLAAVKKHGITKTWKIKDLEIGMKLYDIAYINTPRGPLLWRAHMKEGKK